MQEVRIGYYISEDFRADRYCPWDLEPFATGHWPNNLETFVASVRTFFRKQQGSKHGPYEFEFVMWEIHRKDEPHQVRWQVGVGNRNLAKLKVGETTEADEMVPSFQGWPYAEVEARAVAEGLAVTVEAGPAYAGDMRQWLGLLVKALKRDGLKIEPVKGAAHRGASRIEDRADWEANQEKLREYDAWLGRNLTKQDAADRVGKSINTLEGWRKRLSEQKNQ